MVETTSGTCLFSNLSLDGPVQKPSDLLSTEEIREKIVKIQAEHKDDPETAIKNLQELLPHAEWIALEVEKDESKTPAQRRNVAKILN